MSEVPLGDLARVAVVGTSCCGKTTFARRLAGLLDQPHVELDALHWGPNWTPRAPAEFSALVTGAIASERWVVDGNYSVVRGLVWSRASSIVWLNYSFPLVFGRALRRTIRRALRREELFAGNRETLRGSFFSRESILWWIITTHRRRRRRYRELLASDAMRAVSVHEFVRPIHAENFLLSIGQPNGNPHTIKAHDRYKASSFRAYNEKLASRYDGSFGVRFFQPSTMDDFVLDALGQDIAALAILDVGCATGRLLERLAKAGARELAGVDLAPRILDVARRKLARFDVVADLRSADAETLLPWPADTFDAAVLTGVVHHFCNPQDALREVGRVLRPQGKLIIADACFFPPVRELFNLCLRVHPHEGDCYFYTRKQLRRVLSERGWEVSRCERLNRWFFGMVARRTSPVGATANRRIPTGVPAARR